MMNVLNLCGHSDSVSALRRGSMDFADFVGLFPRFPSHARCWSWSVSFFYMFSGSKFCFTFSRLELSGPPWVPKGTGLGSWTDSALAHSSHNQLVDVWLCDSYFFTHTYIYTRIILYSTYCTIRHIIRHIILTFPKWCSAEFPAGKSEALEFLSTGYGWCLQGKVSWSSSALT